jgi:hypothetical protein
LEKTHLEEEKGVEKFGFGGTLDYLYYSRLYSIKRRRAQIGALILYTQSGQTNGLQGTAIHSS